MVAVPVATPPATPVLLPMVATLVLLLLQVPPPVASVRVVFTPTHRPVAPDMAAGDDITVSDEVA
jgi:hypothetical protein